MYLDRREAIDFAAKHQKDDPKAFNLLRSAIDDKYQGLRIYSIENLNIKDDSIKKIVEPLLANLAKNDPSTLVRASAIQELGLYKNKDYREFFMKSVNDSSYSVAGNALLALAPIDSTAAFEKAKILSSQHIKGALSRAVTNTIFSYASENDFESLASKFDELPFGNSKFNMLVPFSNYLKKVKNPENFRKGIDMIVSFRDTIPEKYRQMVIA